MFKFINIHLSLTWDMKFELIDEPNLNIVSNIKKWRFYGTIILESDWTKNLFDMWAIFLLIMSSGPRFTRHLVDGKLRWVR